MLFIIMYDVLVVEVLGGKCMVFKNGKLVEIGDICKILFFLFLNYIKIFIVLVL